MEKNHFHITTHNNDRHYSISFSQMVKLFGIIDTCLYDPDPEWNDEGRMATIKTYFELWQDKIPFEKITKIR